MELKFLCFLVMLGFLGALGQDLPPDGYDCGYCQPEQLHIAFGEKSNDIIVTWTTFNATNSSRVFYGENSLEKEQSGHSTLFVDGGRSKRRMWIHRVTLTDLKFDTRYIYHAGSVFGWSAEYWFRTPPAGQDWVVRAAIYGDMGMQNAHSLSYLQDEAQRDKYDLILHVGDFAYDMDTDEARVGDQFMRQLEPLAAYLPYMVCPGNHEEAYNFSNYKNRFSMPGGTESMFYSFDLGRVHFVSISTEFYYFLNYGMKSVVNQYYWLVEDLEKANRPENRMVRPWIIIYGHRPMYCSNDDEPECFKKAIPFRTGLPGIGLALEPLLKKFGVDIVIWAHEHSYERTWPLYDNKVYNGSLDEPYRNPKAPIHIVTGSAGCKEEISGFQYPAPAWSAFRSKDYGYTRLEAVNSTHLHFEQVSVNQNGQVIDDFWVTQDTHGSFENLPAPVHIITGSAGCKEGRDPYRHNVFSWSAFHAEDFGYTRLKAYNSTHVHMEQVSVEQGGKVIDEFWLVKDQWLSFNEASTDEVTN